MARLVPFVAILTAAAALYGCLDIGGKLDTPLEGGGTLSGGNGSLGSLGGGDGGAGLATGTFSCDHHTVDSTCTTYVSGTTQNDATAKCDGTLLQTVCPIANAVGTCQVGGEYDKYYADGALPHTATEAEATCRYYGGIFSN